MATDKRIKEDCPFCGHPAKEIQIRTYREGISRIRCPECGATFDPCLKSKQQLIDKWNRRYRPNV